MGKPIENQFFLNSEAIQKDIVLRAENRLDELIKDISDFKKGNQKKASFWFLIYIIVGVTAVISSTVSAVITFLELDKSALLLTAITSTSSSCLLTFLNPSGREEKNRLSLVRSLALIEKAKDAKAYIGIDTDANTMSKISFLSDQFTELIKDSRN